MAKNYQSKTKGSGNRGARSRGDEFDQVIIDIARVTRVMAGGKRMSFRACVVVGDKKGKVGSAVAKGADVTIAVNKAVTKAKKNLINVPIVNETIPHRVDCKFGAAKILLKPAPKGTGVIAGGAIRPVLELAGVSNVVAKILGTKNKMNNVKAAIKALSQFKVIEVRKPPEKKMENNNIKEKDKIDSNSKN